MEETSILKNTSRLTSLWLFRQQSRTVLFVGFGGLLAMMMFAGVDGLRLARRMQQRSTAIQHDFLERSRVLNQIRSDFYLSGTYARDYILDPEPSIADRNGVEVRRLKDEIEVRLVGYTRLMRPDEQVSVEALRRKLQEYWNVLDPALTWSPEQRQEGGFRFLRDEVFPRRTAMVDLADQIQNVNEKQVEEGNARVGELFAEFRTRLSITLAMTVAVGCLLALFAGRRILDLEAETASQYAEVTDARSQLKNLSVRLVRTQEEERRALSRELHDEVGQSLSAISVGLSNLSAATKTGNPERTEEEFASLRTIVEGSVRTVRNLTLLLRPSMLDDLGLIPALEWQGREVSRQSGLHVNISAEAVSDELPEDHKTCVYRVVQEALHNVVKHANATSVWIAARQEPHQLVLSVQDDGRGFDAQTSRGLGLLGMQERVKDMGGTIQLQSKAGEGTLISIALPLDEA